MGAAHYSIGEPRSKYNFCCIASKLTVCVKSRHGTDVSRAELSSKADTTAIDNLLCITSPSGQKVGRMSNVEILTENGTDSLQVTVDLYVDHADAMDAAKITADEMQTMLQKSATSILRSKIKQLRTKAIEARYIADAKGRKDAVSKCDALIGKYDGMLERLIEA